MCQRRKEKRLFHFFGGRESKVHPTSLSCIRCVHFTASLVVTPVHAVSLLSHMLCRGMVIHGGAPWALLFLHKIIFRLEFNCTNSCSLKRDLPKLQQYCSILARTHTYIIHTVNGCLYVCTYKQVIEVYQGSPLHATLRYSTSYTSRMGTIK